MFFSCVQPKYLIFSTFLIGSLEDISEFIFNTLQIVMDYAFLQIQDPLIFDNQNKNSTD